MGMQMGKVCDLLGSLKPTLMMIMVQVGITGVNIFYKLAKNTGLSLPVLIAYRFQFAAATVTPLAFIFEWKQRPKVTRKVLLLTFSCALFGGSLGQNLYAESLALTSATFAAAMTNIIPAVTFVLAIIFRMENLGIKTWGGKAKVVGTCLCIGGAMLLTFYKGYEFKISHFGLLDIQNNQHQDQDHHQHKSNNNILGFFLAFLCVISTSFSLILQAKIGRIFPYNYSCSALVSLMGAIQATVFALFKERDWSQWRLGWNIKLLAAAYMGVVASGLLWVVLMFCVRMRGPLFVSVFNPLMLVLVALVGALFLNEKLYLGSVLGAVIIIIGLYTVLWGKDKELKKLSQLVPSGSIKSNEGGSATRISASESFKGFTGSGHSIIAVAPNFVPGQDMIEMFDGEEEEEEDIEHQIRNHPQAKD